MTHTQRRAYQDAYSKAYRAYKRAGWSVYSCRAFGRRAGSDAAALVADMDQRVKEAFSFPIQELRRRMLANIEKVSESL